MRGVAIGQRPRSEKQDTFQSVDRGERVGCVLTRCPASSCMDPQVWENPGEILA